MRGRKIIVTKQQQNYILRNYRPYFVLQRELAAATGLPIPVVARVLKAQIGRGEKGK